MQEPTSKRKSGAWGVSASPAASPRPKSAARASAKAAEEDVVLAPALSNLIGYLLRRSHNSFQGYWMARFRDSDTPITPVQGGILVVLGGKPGLTQTALARMMNVEGPTLMQSVDRLEQHGYVQRVRRPGDRRSYSLQLTPLGETVLSHVNEFLPVRDDHLLAELSADEVTILADLLTRIVERGHLRLRQLQSASAVDGAAPRGRGLKTSRKAAVTS